MNRNQLAYKKSESPHDYVGDVERYYVWVERPRIPDFDGGEERIEWRRDDRRGNLL